MLLLCRLRMRSHLLGIRIHQVGRQSFIRRFERTDDQKLKTPLPIWDWALRETFSNMGWRDKIDWSAVRPHPVFRADALSIHNRSYFKNEKKKSEDFESVEPGQVIVQPMLLTDGPDNISARKRNGARLPAVGELGAVLDLIGQWCGISPWGNRYGYGRFDVVSVDPITVSDLNDIQGLKTLCVGPPRPGIPSSESDEQEVDPLVGISGIFEAEI